MDLPASGGCARSPLFGSPRTARRLGLFQGLVLVLGTGCAAAALLTLVAGRSGAYGGRRGVVGGRTGGPTTLALRAGGAVGSAPLIPTMCNLMGSSSSPVAVLVEVDGLPYAVVPDTGSSNFNLASEGCGAKCDVRPKWRPSGDAAAGPTFEVVYGTGGADLTVASAHVSLGGVTIEKGSLCAIVDQKAGADGFNLFPAESDPVCYNTYAGILGLAYRGQDAGPLPGGASGTANGTTVPLLDQLVAGAGMPNAFALELCDRYPMPCGPRVDLETWEPSRSCDVNFPIGNFYLGGYRSSSLAGDMQFTPITDEIHYDVKLLGVEVCGASGCLNVSFPDKIGGETEDACVCHTPDCAIPLEPDEYCFFTVIDSGADGVYMNTVNNTHALLDAMISVGMVTFPPGQNSSEVVRSFYFQQTPVKGARPAPQSGLTFYFPDEQGGAFGLRVPSGHLFHFTFAGLVPTAVTGLEASKAFQAAKFPVLLGAPVLQGKVAFFDRSRRRLGFADVDPRRCGAPVLQDSEIDVRGLRVETPGAGCRRGTGSGGGCPQAKRPGPHAPGQGGA